MKLPRILIILIFSILMCCIIAAALPNLDYLTVDDCRGCHGDENGKTTYFHHSGDYIEKCCDCHLDICYSEPDFDYTNCFTCHADFDHHENAQHNCSNCHEDKQKKHGGHK